MGRRSLDAYEILRTVLLLATSFCLVNLLFENTAASVHGSPLFQPYTIVATPSVILDNGTVGSQTIYTNNTSAKVRVAAPLECGPWSDELLVNPSFEMGDLTGWTAMGPAAASVQVFNATSGGDQYTQRSLRVGNYGVCTKDTPGTNDNSGVWQNVSLTAYANAIDAGNAVMNASAWLYPSEWTWDDCALIVRFYNSSGGFISAWNTTGEYGSGTAYNPKAWMLGSGYAHFTQGQLKQFECNNYTIPVGTRTVGIQLGMGEHKDPAYCGGQADEASIKIQTISLPVYYPSDYNVSNGAYVSGTTPSSVQTVDSDCFIVRSLPATSTTAYNPSGCSALGGTALVSGATSDLVSNNNVYMTFRSYVSSSSTASNTSAFVAYRDSSTSLNIPKGRVWDGEAWGSQSEMPTSGSPVRYARTACCPIEQRSCERMVVTLSDDGYLDAYVWDGTSWSVMNNIGFPGTTVNAYKCFDVAYEKTTGRILLAYSRGTATNEIGYRIWTFGSGWGSEQLLNLAYTTGLVRWLSLATAPGTRSGTADDNEIAMIYLDANTDVHGYIWTGSSWSLMGATAVWDASAAIATEECIAVAYEQSSGRAMFVWGDSVATDNYNRIWGGSTLSGPTLGPDITTQGAVTNWVTLKANPINNELMYLVVDGASDLNTAYWSGSAWTVHSEHDGTVDTHAQRCADFAWEPTGSKGLLVYGTTAGQITRKTYTAPNTWGSATSVTMGANTHPWVQLRTNTRSITGDMKILGAVLEGTAFDLGAIGWDGTTFTVIGASTFSADTTVITYECFELEFMNFGPPTEFTGEAEFTGTSNTESWTQLAWSVDSALTTDSVTVTSQVYNYTGAGGYPASGDGYDTYTSNPIVNTDETRNQTITTNPTCFRDGSGNWRIKIKAIKSTATQFDFKVDWIEFKTTHYTDCTVSTEFLLSNMTTNTPTQLNFTVVSQYDIASVNIIIQAWNCSSSTYDTSGEGYINYISSGSNETKLLSISTNPQFYASNGNAKIRITGTKTTTTQYQQETNQVKLTYSYSSSSTYDYVLKIVNQVSDVWNVTLKSYNSSNISRLSSATIGFHDGTSSNQITINYGNITQSEGIPYGLASNATIYISVSNLQSINAETSYLYVYLKIRIPNTTTYLLYVITFEIT